MVQTSHMRPMDADQLLFLCICLSTISQWSHEIKFFFTCSLQEIEYKDIEFIGCGKSGVVIKATYKADNCVYAIKVCLKKRYISSMFLCSKS